MKQNSHITPEGYFNDLKARLHSIPCQQEMPSTWQRVRPHLAMAAAFLAIVTVGTAILRSTAGTPAIGVQDLDSQYELAGLVRTTSPYMYDETEFEQLEAEFSEDDIINYLIDSGVNIENIDADETND